MDVGWLLLPLVSLAPVCLRLSSREMAALTSRPLLAALLLLGAALAVQVILLMGLRCLLVLIQWLDMTFLLGRSFPKMSHTSPKATHSIL